MAGDVLIDAVALSRAVHNNNNSLISRQVPTVLYTMVNWASAGQLKEEEEEEEDTRSQSSGHERIYKEKETEKKGKERQRRVFR